MIIDYSQPMDGITLKRIFDKNTDDLLNITLNGQYSKGSGTEEERTTMVGTNIYEANMGTLNEFGDSSSSIIIPS